MFIATEETPNPQTMMFLPGRDVVPGRPMEFVKDSGSGFEASPLAVRLFSLEGVERIFLGNDFISVSKSPQVAWDDLQPRVLASMMEHYIAGEDTIIFDGESVDESDEEDSEVIKQIKELLTTRVRPAVARDGGDIVFQGFERGIVYVILKGACSGCPSATATLKVGIESLLRHYVPEVVEVRAVF